MTKFATEHFERFGWMRPADAQAIRAFWQDIYPGLFEQGQGRRGAGQVQLDGLPEVRSDFPVWLRSR